MIVPYYKSSDSRFTLLQGDCIELLNSFEFKFDMIFADPPYHLSNGGISVQSGRMVSVNKGTWDKSKGFEEDYKFDRTWLEACRNKLKANGTIWISGTYHNIFSIARCLTELGYKILNCITWVKTNPPPNLSCRYFTHAPWEKSCGKHPTQKPLNVVARAIQASTVPGAWIMDPFTGGSTTGIAANLLNRRFLGIDMEEQFLQISKARKEEIDTPSKRQEYIKRLEKQARLFQDKDIRVLEEQEIDYGPELPF